MTTEYFLPAIPRRSMLSRFTECETKCQFQLSKSLPIAYFYYLVENQYLQYYVEY